MACKPSGLLVVDEDVPGAFTAYAAGVGAAMPSTFTVGTGKGRHLYFRPPDGMPLGNGRGALQGLGIDIRGGGLGNGGYVVGPGSVHASGVVYTPVDSSAPIAPAPDWLIDALTRPGPMRSQVQGGPVGDLSAYARAALQAETARVREAVPGGRNQTLNKAAYHLGRLVGAGVLLEQTAAAALYEAASVHFGTGAQALSPAETQATIRSGLSAGIRRPRTVAVRGQR